MSLTEKDPPVGCSGHCESCAVGEGDAGSAGDPKMTGWRFMLSSVIVFLLPLGLALAGAILLRENKARQLGGAVGGLALGVLLAKGLSTLLAPREKV